MDHRFGGQYNSYSGGEGSSSNYGDASFEYGFQREHESFPGGMEQRLYSSLMTQGRYADLDKAKHNPSYRSYLLENYDEDLPF